MGVLQRLAFLAVAFSLMSLFWAASQGVAEEEFANDCAAVFIWSCIAFAVIWALRGSWGK